MDFQFRPPSGARRHYIDQADVEIVLGRLPPDVTVRIRGIHFTDNARGNRVLGYVTRGRREIALNALPLHVSLNQFIGRTQSAPMFGAVKGAQWPPLAVRRFMLYDVLLHEIGHLQVIHEKGRTVRRKFAIEPAAQDFANRWREDLWSKPFDHADPVHDPPSSEETAALASWPEAHAEYRRGIGLDKDLAKPHFERAVELFPSHSLALSDLASCVVRDGLGKGPGTSLEDEAREGAVELLGRALIVDPNYYYANLRMGWNCGHLGRYEDARRYVARALRHGLMAPRALSALGDAHADWGFLAEAERLFHRALAHLPNDPSVLRNHARAVWDLGAHTPEETSRALSLFERALAAGPNEGRTHYYFARALATLPGETSRALHHAERARTLLPNAEYSAKLVARLLEPLRADEVAHVERRVLSRRKFDRKTGAVVELE